MLTRVELERLERMFNRLADPADWKAPVKATIREDELWVAREAVEFYTATTLRVVERCGSRLVVAALGYRMGPAGDH